MLDNEQVFKEIPRRVNDWSTRDVSRWFQINQIQLSKQIQMDGRQFMGLKGSVLLSEFGLTVFMTRKVLDWIETESEEFNQYVQEMSDKNHTQSHQYYKGQHLEQHQQSGGVTKNSSASSQPLSSKQLGMNAEQKAICSNQLKKANNVQSNEFEKANVVESKIGKVQGKSCRSNGQNQQQQQNNSNTPHQQLINRQPKLNKNVSHIISDHQSAHDNSEDEHQIAANDQLSRNSNSQQSSSFKSQSSSSLLSEEHSNSLTENQSTNQNNIQNNIQNSIQHNNQHNNQHNQQVNLQDHINNQNKPYQPFKAAKWRSQCQNTKNNPSIQLPQNSHSQNNKNNQHPLQTQDKKNINSCCQQQKSSNPKNNKNKIIRSLLLDDIITINTEENYNSDIETCKIIPERDYNLKDQSYQNDIDINLKQQYAKNIKKFGKISSQNSLVQDISINPQLRHYFLMSSHESQQNVKFATSQLMTPNGSLLTAFYENTCCQINKNIKIGRATNNQILLKAEGVSRSHAEIIIQNETDSKNNLEKKYYLRDVGSKYGTFIVIDPQRPKKVNQNDQYCIGQTTIKIDKLKMYKSKGKFDIVVSLTQFTERQIVFENKSLITIGNRRRQVQSQKQSKSSQTTKRSSSSIKEKRDIELEDNEIRNYHCRFVVISDEIYLEQVEGNIFEKLQKNVKYPLNKQQIQVKFGDGNVTFRLEQSFKLVLNND